MSYMDFIEGEFSQFVKRLVSDPESGVTWEGDFRGERYTLRYTGGFIRGTWGETYVVLPWEPHWNYPCVWGQTWADWVRAKYGKYSPEFAEELAGRARERALGTGA